MRKYSFAWLISIGLILTVFISISCDSGNSGNGTPQYGDLSGVVRDGGNTLPVGEARILAVGTSKSDTTDEGGNYNLDSLNIGNVTVRVEALGYDTLETEITISLAKTEKDFLLGVPPCDKRLVEDPNRTYIIAHSGTEISFNHRSLFFRFAQGETDSASLAALAESYGISVQVMEQQGMQWVGIGCVPDTMIVEYYLTPYGKEGYCNFGADQKVEFCTGMWYEYTGSFDGIIGIQYYDNVTRDQKDSLYSASGLRFRFEHPDIDDVFITRQAPKNVADLAVDLTSEPIIKQLWVGFFEGGPYIDCGD